MRNIKGLALSERSESNGFTLIEILVVIALLGVLGLVLTNILTQVLRGQNKINIINLVKQNGQVILDQISNEIRSSEKIICLESTSMVLFKSENRDSNYTRLKIIAPTLSLNGYFTKENFTKFDIPDGVTESSMCSNGTQFNPVNLTDKNDIVNGVSVDYDKTGGIDQPVFTKLVSQPGFPDLISIKFRAKEGVKTSSNVENTITESGVLFTTSISLRGGK